MSTNIDFVPSSKSSADSRRSNVSSVATNSMSSTTETTYHFSGDENEDFDKIVRKELEVDFNGGGGRDSNEEGVKLSMHSEGIYDSSSNKNGDMVLDNDDDGRNPKFFVNLTWISRIGTRPRRERN